MKKRIWLLCPILVLLCAMLFSCGSSDKAGGGDSSAVGTVVGGEISSATLTDRKMIVTVRYTIETLTFNDTITSLETAVTTAGGYIGSSNITPKTEDSTGYAYYTLRIPAERADNFSASLSGLGNVTYRSVDTEDVTLSYTDTASRIASLEEEETRVRELYAQATTTSELLQIETRLTEISAELTSLRQQLAVLDNQVEYATFYVTLRDVSAYTSGEENFFVRFGHSFVNSFTVFVKVLGNIIIGLLYALPYLLVVALIVTAVMLLMRRKKKK